MAIVSVIVTIASRCVAGAKWFCNMLSARLPTDDCWTVLMLSESQNCPISQWERAVLAQWFAGTDRTGPGAISAAYVSERSRDEPCIRNKIVIAERDRRDIGYLIHRPFGELAWVLICARTETELGRYRTLPEVLQQIRPTREDRSLAPDITEPRISAPAGG